MVSQIADADIRCSGHRPHCDSVAKRWMHTVMWTILHPLFCTPLHSTWDKPSHVVKHYCHFWQNADHILSPIILLDAWYAQLPVRWSWRGKWPLYWADQPVPCVPVVCDTTWPPPPSDTCDITRKLAQQTWTHMQHGPCFEVVTLKMMQLAICCALKKMRLHRLQSRQLSNKEEKRDKNSVSVLF